ncbi:MAG: TrkA family potassium uptake protein [Tissierellia bacterium]|nr:TrkA family potassium uptake protein [Tissierellia bacterium]
MKSFVVIGIGRFGSSLVQTLFNMGYDVMAIDKSHDAIQAISEYTTEAIECDVRAENSLRAVGLANFDAGIVSMGSDLESSILATISLKEQGVPKVIAKAQNLLHGTVLKKVGADEIVYPEREMGERVAHRLINSHILEYISLSTEYGMLEIQVLSTWIGQTLGEVKIRNKYNVNVVAIQRDEETIINPQADMRMEQGDHLVVIGSTESLEQLESLISDDV